MTKNNYKYFEIMNAAAMKAESINPNGTFVFRDINIPKLLKKDAQKNNITFDEASAETEFKIENDNIVMYPSFEHVISAFPVVIESCNLKENYCYYSQKENRLVILEFDSNNNPYSFYFSSKNEIENNKEYSFSNVFYWQKIYELLHKNISEEVNSDRSIPINSYEKGRCKFNYVPYNSLLNDKDLKSTYNHFEKVFKLTNLYPMLLKNRCVETITESNESTLELLISGLDEICSKTETDFAIFVAKIDFDSYIQKYNDKLEDVFSQARSMIERMLSNIFTLPLTYAGAIFTFDKLTDNSFAQFIFIAMCIYTFFSCGFLIYEFVDTFSINKNFNKELISYTNNSRFLLEKLEPDKKSIKRRLIGIRIACLLLVCIFVILIIILGIKILTNGNTNLEV